MGDPLLTSRTVPEWRSDNPDAAIPKRVVLRVWDRCSGKCAITGKKLRPGDGWQVDHILALVNGGEHREANLQIVSTDAHTAKTRVDVGIKAKTDRMRAKNIGAWPKSRRPLKSRGFEKSRPIP